ncbi:metallophosphoesterase [Lacticaseibacillus parakribbianus]|uniref:metallophosphoesterase n=1 Tax=Lacticaseibacillus parakribbianus TaxID=2970927 RepID=UPI0021CB14F0|nr:metallophosphoesterase [Lacticaseibacillus parakribbianus]
MALYCLSDVHGDLAAFDAALALILFTDPKTTCYILGDLIDCGEHSYGCLQRAFELAKRSNQVTVQLGNHEAMFLDFLFGEDTLDWLTQDVQFKTTLSFFSPDQWQALLQAMQANVQQSRQLVRQALLAHHRRLLTWLQSRPLVTELDAQILVHAGIDEAAGPWWRMGTPDEVLTGKYPATTGRFAKIIIAGHVSAAEVAGDRGFEGHLYCDGKSHFYIDGTTLRSHVVPVLRVRGKRYEELCEDGVRVLLEQD